MGGQTENICDDEKHYQGTLIIDRAWIWNNDGALSMQCIASIGLLVRRFLTIAP